MYEDQPPRRSDQMSTEVATEHVETLLAAAEELAEACVMIAKQLRPRPSDPVGPQTTRPPSVLRAATLLDQAAGSTGDTRRLLRSTLIALAQADRRQPADGAVPKPVAETPPQPAPKPAPPLATATERPTVPTPEAAATPVGVTPEADTPATGEPVTPAERPAAAAPIPAADLLATEEPAEQPAAPAAAADLSPSSKQTRQADRPTGRPATAAGDAAPTPAEPEPAAATPEPRAATPEPAAAAASGTPPGFRRTPAAATPFTLAPPPSALAGSASLGLESLGSGPAGPRLTGSRAAAESAGTEPASTESTTTGSESTGSRAASRAAGSGAEPEATDTPVPAASATPEPDAAAATTPAPAAAAGPVPGVPEAWRERELEPPDAGLVDQPQEEQKEERRLAPEPVGAGWAPAYGGSTPSTGGSAAPVLPSRGRHALDETGTWVRSDIVPGRHALPSESEQPVGPRRAYSVDLPKPVALTRLAPPELPPVPPQPRFETREVEPVRPSLHFPEAPVNAGYQPTEPPYAAPAPPSYGPGPYAPPALPAFGRPEPAGAHAYPDYPPPDYPAANEHYYPVPPEVPPPAFTRQVEPFPEPDPTQLATTVRQVESARRHLQAALLTLREALGAGGDVSMLAQVERTLSVATAAVSTLRDALDLETAERALPGEARFCCSLPWLNTVLAPVEISTAPATVPGATRILAALGYDAAVGHTVDGQPQANVAGPGYRARIVLQQLRLAGSGEWLAYLDWHDATGQPRSEVETLGPAELTEDEVARRVDDALRRRLI